ncbi:MAG: SH3 domain-containing protein [Oscillochloris sp.]|nr:SH3 domain-containing protein [Oscillochloris sp.]
MTMPLDSSSLPSPTELLDSARRKYTLAQARMRRGPAELALLSLHGSIEDALRAHTIRRRLPAAVAPFPQLVETLAGIADGGLEPAEAETIRRMHRLRARVAHGEQITVTAETIANYQRLVARILPRFGAVVIGPDDMSSPAERAGFDPLQAAPPGDEPRQRSGRSTVSLERTDVPPPRSTRTTTSFVRDDVPPPRSGRTTTSYERDDGRRQDRRSRSTSDYPLLDRYPDLARRDLSQSDDRIARTEQLAGMFSRVQSWLIPTLIIVSIFLIGLAISFTLQQPPSEPQPPATSTGEAAFAPVITTAPAINSAIQSDAADTTAPEPTVTPEPTPEGLRPQSRATVVDSIPGLNLRAQPGQDQQIVLSLAPGTEVEVLEGPIDLAGLEWWRVRSAGIEGWCVGEFLVPR